MLHDKYFVYLKYILQMLIPYFYFSKILKAGLLLQLILMK